MRKVRIFISFMVLVIFFGAILVDYWSELLPGVLSLLNSARSVGAESVESKVFDVRNSSNATPAQVGKLVNSLENQAAAISQTVNVAPSEKLRVLIVNGRGPALLNGQELVINYADGMMDTDLAPLYLVLMIEGIPLKMDDSLVLLAGYGLHVVEEAGQGSQLIRQPLDSWTVLLQKRNAYLPLEEALRARVPNDESSGYVFIRAMLESGSFMKWFARQSGLDASRALAQGEDIVTLSGKSLAENEAEWLESISTSQTIQPKSCKTIVPQGSLFGILCKGLDGVLQ